MEDSRIKIKEIFLKAIELPESEREEFIKSECQGDEELYNEVHSLVANHKEDSIFEAPTKERMDLKSRKKEESEFDITLKKIQKKRSKKLRYNLVLIGIILTLITIGIWTQQRMKSSILNINEHSLKHNLDATVLSLDEWVKNQENIVVALSKDSLVVASVDYLTNKYGLGKFGHKDSIWEDPVHIRLVTRMDPILDVLESPSFSIVDVSGFRIATNLYKQLGAQINEVGFKELVPSLQNEGPKFTRPYLQETYTSNKENVGFDVPITWIDCAINKGDNPIASLGLTFYAETGFNEVLAIHRIGRNGHTYAFDETGLLISSITDVDELVEYGILKEGEDPMLNLYLINPSEVIKDHKVDLEKYRASEQILPVRNALVDRRVKTTGSKAISSPYITFNGQKVIGAYVWLPKYNIGIITELPAEETLEPVHYLNLILIILIGLLIGFVLYSFISSYQVAKLHKEIGETSKLGQYTLIKHIGEGGMGEVYLAKHAFLSRPNAIKLLKSDLSNNKDTVKRFEREVQLASQLTNPHTIQIHDFGYTQGDRFYYAMEFLEGVTLADLIKIEGSLPLNRVIYLLRQICYSLQETHDHGLVHRDIKPMNIMICKLGGMYDYIKVLDFGLVKDIEGGEDLEMTQEAYIQGTPVYMAPERFLRPQLNDPKSDIYSIGMVAYYLVTGRKVFDHIDRTSLLSEILNAQPKEMTEFISDSLPAEFIELVMKCLEKDLDDRPSSIKDLLSVIDSIKLEEWEQDDAKSWWDKNMEQDQ
jgi:hypothetical protein